MKIYYTYILKCSDGTFYTWVTNDLDRRIIEHSEWLIYWSYTHSRRPIKLMYHEEYCDIRDAIQREKQIKWWSRIKKQSLIDWTL